MSIYRLSDFDYDLPSALIAQSPAPERSASRLLHVDAEGGFHDRQFTDLIDLLRPDDLLVFNNSKVIPARLYARKPTGGRIELLVEKITGTHSASVLMKASKKPVAGSVLQLEIGRDASLSRWDVDQRPDAQEGLHLTLVGRSPQAPDRFLIQTQNPILDVLDAFGEIPLPPYIAHRPDASDAQRYQTVFAQHPGSVAAPTAGLHFDASFMDVLAGKGIQICYVTLHVGSGTFSPVRHEDLRRHEMHTEWCSLSEQTAEAIARTQETGGRVIAVGTTSLRTLESAAARVAQGALLHGQWETNLFITPGYRFQMVDALVTNFHLPKSTLLMLVCAFAGYETIRSAYDHAIDKQYRFFSYGDAMFLSACSSSETSDR